MLRMPVWTCAVCWVSRSSLGFNPLLVPYNYVFTNGFRADGVRGTGSVGVSCHLSIWLLLRTPAFTEHHLKFVENRTI